MARRESGALEYRIHSFLDRKIAQYPEIETYLNDVYRMQDQERTR